MNFQFSNVMCMLYVVCFVEKDLKFVSQNNIKISRKITSFLVYSSASTNKQPEKNSDNSLLPTILSSLFNIQHRIREMKNNTQSRIQILFRKIF
jgi:hypothetical protein